jgi:two-component system response regulator NreC
MDISMPSMDGLEATRKLKELLPTVQVLALSVHNDKQYLFEMMTAGASGYLTKQSAATDLVEAVRTVAKGNVYLQPVLARWLLDDYRRLVAQPCQEAQEEKKTEPDSDHKDLSVLSVREKQVLEMVAEGYTSPQIGERLEISPKTVAHHRERIMNKLHLHSSAELVKFAIRTGLIDVNGR